MRLGVGFWSGVNPDNIASTLQRLQRPELPPRLCRSRLRALWAQGVL